MGRSRVTTASRAVFRSEGRRSLRGRLAQAKAREAELERLLRESELRRAQAEDRAEKVHRLAGAVAHDVNNLLGVVALVASSLREKLAPRIREQADELCDSAIRAARLNRQLLALGRHDLRVGDEGTVDVNLVIDGMRRLLERLAGASLDLVVDLDDEPCVVRADPAQLERVIINLVTNARDAMPDRGTLRIETAHAATREGPRGEAVVVRVSDTGPGMDPATQGRIFEPFFTTKGSAGNGLGLAAVRDIVAACGGSVQVESQPGGGTRFEVLLPVSSACGTLPASAPSSA